MRPRIDAGAMALRLGRAAVMVCLVLSANISEA
jgi:hypothetical protein